VSTAGFSLDVVDTGTTASLIIGRDVYHHSVTTQLTLPQVRLAVRPTAKELIVIDDRSAAALRVVPEFLVDHNIIAALVRLVVVGFSSTTPPTVALPRVQFVEAAHELITVDDRSATAPRTVPELLVDQNTIAAQMSIQVVDFTSTTPRITTVGTILYHVLVTTDGRPKVVRG